MPENLSLVGRGRHWEATELPRRTGIKSHFENETNQILTTRCSVFTLCDLYLVTDEQQGFTQEAVSGQQEV